MGVAPSKEKVDGLIRQAIVNEARRRRIEYADESDYVADEYYDYAQDYDDDAEFDVDDTSAQSIPRQPPLPPTVRQEGKSIARQCLEEILPASDDYTYKRKKKMGPLGWQIWKTEAERSDFITTALIVLSGNGERCVSNLRVHLFIPRGGALRMWRAALAVMDEMPDPGYFREDMLLYTFAARNFASSKKDAFQQLVYDIEAMLDGHINDTENHISRFGAHLGRQQLLDQYKNRAVLKIEQDFDPYPGELGAAVSGVSEPPEIRQVYSSTVLPYKMKATLESAPRYNGFMVDEVASKNLGTEQHKTGVLGAQSSASMHTTGGVGAMPYREWMQPVGEISNDHLRLRDIQQMQKHSMHRSGVAAQTSMSSMNTIQTIPDGTPCGSVMHGADGHALAQQDPQHHQFTRGVLPLSRSGVYNAISSASVSPQSSTSPSPPNSTSSSSTNNNTAASRTAQLGSRTSLAHSTTSQIVEPASGRSSPASQPLPPAPKKRCPVKFQLPSRPAFLPPHPKSILKGSPTNTVQNHIRRPAGRHVESRPLNDKSNSQQDEGDHGQLHYHGMEQLKPDEEHDRMF
ncbi:hypothetical protein BST61_g9271 [Cercospora zeina]